MGAKTWMLVYADGNPRERLAAMTKLDRAATQAWVATLFPNETLGPLGDTDLCETSPPDDEVVAGSFNGVSIVAAKEFGLDLPSTLATNFVQAAHGRDLYLHAMHSVVDWFAFALWREGRLQRSLSVSPDSGILEDTGSRLAFELPYWRGDHPAIDPEDMEDSASDYPFPFHPLELGEAALREFFGYQIEGDVDDALLTPEAIPLMRFKRRKKSRFRFW
ncbi:DUF6928 family protein [Roseateles sp.]|uniref:DUF6928 family protein n=1 Tax=Roseateles sp. TaxID=1971397 RepID=UPI0039EC46A1